MAGDLSLRFRTRVGRSGLFGFEVVLVDSKRLIFESSVRAGTPNFAAAPVCPEIRPRDSANAASIISFSRLISVP